MSAILIVTELGDIHAASVQWALRRLGHRCWRWRPEELETQRLSVGFVDGARHISLSGPDGVVPVDEIDTVWLRRFSLPTFSDAMAPGDQLVAKREVDNFLRGVNDCLPARARWVNAPASECVADLKARQLVVAQRVGLTIPPTLLSNDMEAVAAFVRETRGP